MKRDDPALEEVLDVLREHTDTIESARRHVAHGWSVGRYSEAAAALVAFDEALRAALSNDR